MQNLELNDIANELLIINNITIEKLFLLPNGAECVALYIFYYKTAKWQKTNQIKANDEYCKACLHWGDDKFRKVKQTLIDNGLIEGIKTRTNNRISGWYIKINYCKISTPLKSKELETLVLGNEEQMLNNNNINAYNNNINAYKENNNTNVLLKESKKKDNFKAPTLEEIEQYCLERKNNVDAKKFYDYYSVNDWKDSKGNKVKSWKQKMIANWENKEVNTTAKEESKYSPQMVKVGTGAFQII